MNTPRSLATCLVALLCAACGGGGDGSVSPPEAARLLIDQGSECFAVASGRIAPDRFNAVAAEIASVPMTQVCLAWPAGLPVDCPSAYAAMSRPFSDGAQCKAITN